MKDNILVINENTRVTSDDVQYILETRHEVQDKDSKNLGKVTWRVDGFFSSIKGLLNHLANKEIMRNLGDLKEAMRKIDELKKIFDYAK